MRNYREPLKYSVVAPSRYTVYVHPDEIVRLNGILPLLREQAERALAEEVSKLNRRSLLRGLLDWLLIRSRPATESASGGWHVEFLPDPDGELDPGGILVHSELLLPSSPELGAGQRTRRITTVRNGPHTTSREHVEDPPTTKVKVMARLEYRRRRPARLRHRQRLGDDRPRRDRLSRRHENHGVTRRVARACAHPVRRGDPPLLSHRPQLARHHHRRPPGAAGLRRRRRRQARERRRGAAARRRAGSGWPTSSS